MLEPEQKLRRAFDSIYDKYPYLAGFVSTWQVRESKQVPTMATNGKFLYWNREFVASLSVTDTCDVVLHEAGHVFLGHHLRQERRDNAQWNIAADLALNDLLVEYYNPAGKVREIGLFPGYNGSHKSKFYAWPAKLDAEAYYKKLMAEPKPPGPTRPAEAGEDGEVADGEGEEGEESEGQGSSGSGDQTSEAKPKPSKKAEEPEEEDEDEAEGAGDEPDDSEPENYTPSAPVPTTGSKEPQVLGEILPAPIDEDDPDALEHAEQEWEEVLAQSINAAKSQGELPGWVAEVVDAMHGEKAGLEWRLLLRQFMSAHSNRGFSYSRPSRRHGWRKDVILPARRSRTASPGAILLDTSGSMDTSDLNRALAELEGILRAFEDAEVTLVQCDTRISDTRVFHRGDFPLTVPMEWRGRGGTELGGAIAELGASRKYHYLVIITDMEWSVGRVKDPGIPTLWIPTEPPSSGGGYWGGDPKFGQVIPYRAFKG